MPEDKSPPKKPDRSAFVTQVQNRLPHGWRCQYNRDTDTFVIRDGLTKATSQVVKGPAVQEAVEKGEESLVALLERTKAMMTRRVPMKDRMPARPLSKPKQKPEGEEENRG